jgi:hypothetical protein
VDERRPARPRAAPDGQDEPVDRPLAPLAEQPPARPDARADRPVADEVGPPAAHPGEVLPVQAALAATAVERAGLPRAVVRAPVVRRLAAARAPVGGAPRLRHERRQRLADAARFASALSPCGLLRRPTWPMRSVRRRRPGPPTSPASNAASTHKGIGGETRRFLCQPNRTLEVAVTGVAPGKRCRLDRIRLDHLMPARPGMGGVVPLLRFTTTDVATGGADAKVESAAAVGARARLSSSQRFRLVWANGRSCTGLGLSHPVCSSR